MFVFALVGVATAACVLPGDIDPNAACLEDANGFSTLDADSDPAIPISLAISSKGAHEDAFKVVHPATAGALTDDTATDGRYILACPQEAGKKTVQLTVSRPADLTAFGAEWVQLFPKDSWSNTTNEYEPFSFNDFGAKIPLAEFRATSNGLSDDAANIPELHVFMEVKDEGDYEVKYGNPYLKSNEKWVAVEFKSTLLRVGDPWADCTDDALAAPSYSVGSIMPVLFGGPNVNSIAQKAGLPSYDDVIAELSGVSVPVKVVLEVFNADKTSYTSSAVDSQCYKAGNSCPENHAVCKPEYCEMDVWAAIIAGLKGASPGMVTVLGSLDSSTLKSDYNDLDMDGFYLVETEGTTPARKLTDAPSGNLRTEYDTNKCMDYNFNDANVYMHGCHGGNNQQWVFTGQDGSGTLTTLHDNKCLDYNFNTGNVYMYTCHGGNNQLWHINPDGTMGTSHDDKCLDFDYGNNNVYMHTCHGGANQIWVHPQRTQNAELAAMFTVAAIGAPLFDESAVADADVYVTLAASDLGLWNPFSWYPYVSPSKWAAMVTDATDTSAIATLIDRGYGWVYLTSEAGFDTKSTLTPAVLSTIEAAASARRLQNRRLQAAEPFWGCDDTLLECRPICMKQMGAVTTKVSDRMCAAAPMNQCECKCYHEAQWTCEGEAIVCKARHGAGDLETVGDMVCEMRGAPKPTSTAELRIAGECTPMTDMRGSAPTEECLAQWATPEPQEAQPQEGEMEEFNTESESEDSFTLLVKESFAAPLALAAIALYA